MASTALVDISDGLTEALRHVPISRLLSHSGVCHGPIVLAKVKLSDGSYLVKGHEMTALSNAEEDSIKLLQHMPYNVETLLQEYGAKYSKAESIWGEKIVESGRLITGQNPASGALCCAVEGLPVMRRTHGDDDYIVRPLSHVGQLPHSAGLFSRPSLVGRKSDLRPVSVTKSQ